MFDVRLIQALPLAVACLCALFCASAFAAPITVNLRVEGSTTTVFEGPITTQGIQNPPGISTALSAGAHACDVKDNGKNGGEGASAATPTTALHDAAASAGLAFNASWSTEFNDFFVTQVGSDVNQVVSPFDSWGYAVNYTTANVGGCQFQLAPGSEVLWAYNYFNLVHLLSLSGPATVTAGVPFSVRVTDGQTGEPIPQAAIGEEVRGMTTSIPSSPLTNANGETTMTLTRLGSVTLKATRSDSVRSNGLVACVHAANDGSCGTTVAQGSGGVSTTTSNGQTSSGQPPAGSDVAQIVGIKSGHVYRRRAAPRVLRGLVKVPVGDTLHQTRIRLERRHDGHCFNFSGSRESFLRAGRCGTASFFSVGATESFSYLLPTRLPAGRYVYDMDAVENTGKITKLVSGVSHIVFRVK